MVGVLSRAECFSLLAAATVGRVALSVRALPAIVPVVCGLHGDDVVVRALADARVSAAMVGTVVAFQTDALDAAGETAWTVQVVGRCDPIEDPATIDEIARLWRGRPVAGTEGALARIVPHEVSGVRFPSTG